MDQLVASGRSIRELAGEFDVSYDSAKRHYRNGHAQTVKAAPKVEVPAGANLRERLEAQLSNLEQMAEQPGLNHRAYLETLREVRLLAESIAKYGFEAPPTQPLVESQEWIDLCTFLFRTLRQYPDAYTAVRIGIAARNLDPEAAPATEETPETVQTPTDPGLGASVAEEPVPVAPEPVSVMEPQPEMPPEPFEEPEPAPEPIPQDAAATLTRLTQQAADQYEAGRIDQAQALTVEARQLASLAGLTPGAVLQGLMDTFTPAV